MSWYGRIVPPPFPAEVGLAEMLQRNERSVVSAAHANIHAVGGYCRGLPANSSSAELRIWEGPAGKLRTRKLDPNQALPVVDSRGRYFGHGEIGRRRMIAHAQEVMAGGIVTVPYICDVRDKDPYIDDIRERPHTPIIDGNQRAFVLGSSHSGSSARQTSAQPLWREMTASRDGGRHTRASWHGASSTSCDDAYSTNAPWLSTNRTPDSSMHRTCLHGNSSHVRTRSSLRAYSSWGAGVTGSGAAEGSRRDVPSSLMEYEDVSPGSSPIAKKKQLRVSTGAKPR